MVAIVSGNSLGLDLSTLGTGGQRGVFGEAGLGQARERTYVNVATGNLVVQDTDDYVASAGNDIAALRTYNSLGQFADDNGDNWSNGFYTRQLTYNVSVAALNTAGSTVTRTAADGSLMTFAYQTAGQFAGLYTSNLDAGAIDTLKALDTGGGTYTFTWTDGSSGSSETYAKTAAGEGQLASSTDNRGNTTNYQYNDSGRCTKITDASGESITYVYDTTGTKPNLLREVKYTNAAGIAENHVRYEYDLNDRLFNVKVDLTPADQTDSSYYVTSYLYEGTSKRLASITQSDGTTLAFAYDGSNRISLITDGAGNALTKFTYTPTSGAITKTTVTDRLNNVTTYEFDAAGRFSKVTGPAADGSLVTTYTYSADGDLTKVQSPLGRTLSMDYENGNQTRSWDGAGNYIHRTFDKHNQLLTEEVYTVADGDGPLTAQSASVPLVTRYVYDDLPADAPPQPGNAKTLLRFAISAEGRVTEYRYDDRYRLQYTREYTAATLDVTALGASTPRLRA